MTIIERIIQAYNFYTGELKCPCKHPVKDHYKPSPIRNGQCHWDGCACDHKDANNSQSMLNDWKQKIKEFRAGK